MTLMVAATTEGISALAATGRLPEDRVGEVVAAVRALLPHIKQQLGVPADGPVTAPDP